MKLVTYLDEAGDALPGAISRQEVVDLSEIGYPDMRVVIEGGKEAFATVRATIDHGNKRVSLNQVKLAAPITNPSKIVCVGLNYADHCREQNLEKPTSPVLFAKFPTAINHPEGAITWPADSSQQVDFEAELGVVIGKVAKNISEDAAYDVVAGYTIVNDISARDVQFSDGQWIRGKSFDTFCPMGPYLVTPDEVGDPQELAITCRVNGQVMQESNTYEMIFRIPFLIEFITRTCTLLPGDIISTGTPAGVGVFRDPKVFLKPGDVIEVEIEKLGLLCNTVE